MLVNRYPVALNCPKMPQLYTLHICLHISVGRLFWGKYFNQKLMSQIMEILTIILVAGCCIMSRILEKLVQNLLEVREDKKCHRKKNRRKESSVEINVCNSSSPVYGPLILQV